MKYKTIEEQNFWENTPIKCDDTGELTIGYKNYLKTRHWKDIRISIYRKYDRKCSKCGKAIQLRDANVHHSTYDRVGHEDENDLVLLCIPCHKDTHNIVTKKRTKKSWKEKTFKKRVK